MKIAIASGKGGTGKTTVATNLAYSIAKMGKVAQYLDCDVEEPNGHIFLKPDIKETRQIEVSVPRVDPNKCTGCGKCSDLCQYSAIICLKGKAFVFEQLCRSCGGCILVCPAGAITEKPKLIGSVELGSTGAVKFVQGKLQIGDIHTPALIKHVKQNATNQAVIIIDAPPGTSCPVVEAVKGADFVLLITEPTPFGLNDLQIALEMVKKLNLRSAVVINRSDIGDRRVHRFCKQENIDIFLEIPNDRRIAEAYSVGKMIIDVLPEYQKKFVALYHRILTALEVQIDEA